MSPSDGALPERMQVLRVEFSADGTAVATLGDTLEGAGCGCPNPSHAHDHASDGTALVPVATVSVDRDNAMQILASWERKEVVFYTLTRTLQGAGEAD